jgi:hypothetical protein
VSTLIVTADTKVETPLVNATTKVTTPFVDTTNVTATGHISTATLTATSNINTNTFTATGTATFAASKWVSAGTCGINMRNSDIININGLYIGDQAEPGEGLIFLQNSAASTAQPSASEKVDNFLGYNKNLYWLTDLTIGVDEWPATKYRVVLTKDSNTTDKDEPNGADTEIGGASAHALWGSHGTSTNPTVSLVGPFSNLTYIPNNGNNATLSSTASVAFYVKAASGDLYLQSGTDKKVVI